MLLLWLFCQSRAGSQLVHLSQQVFAGLAPAGALEATHLHLETLQPMLKDKWGLQDARFNLK